MRPYQMARLGVSGNFSPFINTLPGQSTVESGMSAAPATQEKAAETAETLGSGLLALALAGAGTWVGLTVGTSSKFGGIQRVAGWLVGGLSAFGGIKVLAAGAKKVAGA